ncbi:MAG: sialidase family protein [Patescibacteria group bacterium]|jgi:hypothetical protein
MVNDENSEYASDQNPAVSKPGSKFIIALVAVAVVIAIGAIIVLLRQPKDDTGITDVGTEATPTETVTKAGLRTYETLSFDQASEVAGDPYGDKNGPYYHKVYKATSTDGLTFSGKELVADKSSVPDVVRMADGTLFLYAVDGAKRSTQGLMVSVSKDNGKTWKQGSVSIPTNGEVFVPADPQAVLLDDGQIRLFFVAFPAKKPPLDANGVPIPTNELNKIKTAISTDGLNFTLESGSRYETTEILTDPDVVKIGGKWFMYLAKGSKQIAFSSSDGQTFNLEKTIRTDGAISKTVDVGGGTYRQFFCKAGIASATTTDGLNFINDSGVRLAENTGEIYCDPTPVKVGTEWQLYYKVAPAAK